MIGIGAEAIPGEFGKDSCSTLFRVLQFFDHHNSCTFPHDKTITTSIERTGSGRRVIIAGAESLHIPKPSKAHR